MNIYGYEKNKKDLLEMSEISLQCSINELKLVIDFLNNTLEEHKSVKNKTDMCHSHFKDFNFQHDETDPDIIVVSKFKE